MTTRRDFMVMVGGTLLLPGISLSAFSADDKVELVPAKGFDAIPGGDLVEMELWRYNYGPVSGPVASVLLPRDIPTEKAFEILERLAEKSGHDMIVDMRVVPPESFLDSGTWE